MVRQAHQTCNVPEPAEGPTKFYQLFPRVVEHRVDALLGGDAHAFFEFHVLRLFRMTERLQNVLERVRLHVLAHAAAADKGLVREFILHTGIQAAFGEQQERGAFGLFLDVAHHLAGAAYVVAQEGDARMAFGVAHHFEARVLTAEEIDEFGIVGFVHVAAAAVEHDFFLDAALLHLVDEVLAHESVGHEHDLVVFEARDNLHHVAARDAHVAVRLHIGGGVDVAHEGVVGVLFAESLDFGAGNGVGEATTRERTRNQHVLGGVQDLGGFAHKTHGREHNRLGAHLGSVLAQLETVAVVVGNSQNDFGGHVAVGEDHGVAFLLQLVDFVDEREHLFALFHGISAEDGTRLNGAKTFIKFFCCHSSKYSKL